MASYDVVVAGLGSTGSSIAYYLALKGAGRILALDKSCPGCGQTGMSSAIIRTQYSHPEARKMAVYSWRYIREKFQKETGCQGRVFYEIGVAYGAAGDQVREVVEIANALRGMGVDIRIMDPEEFSKNIHSINTEGLEKVSWEPHGGYGDPHTLVTCFLDAARRMGVEVRTHTRIVGLDIAHRAVRGIRLENGEVIRTGVLVNAMNVWSNKLLSKYGLQLPLTIAREDVVVFSHSGHRAGPVWADLVLGFYSRAESAEATLVGGLEPEPVEEESIEPGYYRDPPPNIVLRRGNAASKRLPYIAGARPRAAWYGFYDVSPDWQPILGEDYRVEGLVHAVGLSGHGFKLSPAIGDIVSDIIVRGKPSLIDSRALLLERFEENRMERGKLRYGILG